MVQKYTSLYKDDPIAEELAAGIQGTDVYQGSPYALANVPEFEGVRYATPDYNRYQDLYGLYMGGGYDASQDDFPIQAGDITGGQTIDAGAGDAAQIPGAIDTLVAPPAMDQTGAKAAMTGDLAYTGGDTIPYRDPIMDMVDTGTDYSNVGLTSPKRSGMDTVIRDAPVNLIEQDIGSQHPMAKEAVGTTPPDTIGPQPVNIVEPDIGSQHPLNLMSAKVPPAVETVPGPFDYLQPEETFQEKLDRQTIPMSYTIPGGGEISVDEETGGVQPAGMAGDVIEEVSQAPMDPTKMIPQVPPYTDPIMDPTLMGIRQDQLVSQQETPESIGEKLRNLKDVTYDPEKNTVEIAGRKFNLLDTAVRAAINTMVGKPISLLFDALQAIPQYEPTFEERTLEEELGVTEDGKFSGDPTESAFAGLNAVSAFGDPVQSAKDRIEKRLETIENNPDISAEFKANTKTMIDEWEAVTDKLGDVEGPIDTLGDTEVSLTQRFADQAAAEKAEAERIMQEQIAAEAEEARIEAERRRLQEINAIQQGSGDGPQVVDAGTADIQDYADIYEPPAPTPSYSPPSYSPPSHHGNGGGNQGGNQGGSTSSGGGYSRGDYGGGFHWAKGGRVGYGLGSLRKRRY